MNLFNCSMASMASWSASLLLVNLKQSERVRKLAGIVRLLVATLHVGMTLKQDGGYTDSVGTTSMGLSSLDQNIIHSPVAKVVYG